MQPRYGVEEHACTHILQLCVLYMRPHGYIYITYIHNHIYIHISYTWVRKRTCVTSKCTPEIEHTTLKKKLCSKDHVLSETGWKWLCFGWSPNFCQFFPQLKSQVLWMKSPLKGAWKWLESTEHPRVFPPVFPSARWTFDFRQLWSHRRLWGAVEGWRWQSICNQYVMVPLSSPSWWT